MVGHNIEDIQPIIQPGIIELTTPPTIQSVEPPSSSHTPAQPSLFDALKSDAKQEPDLSLEEQLMLSDDDESLISSCPPLPPPLSRTQAKGSTNTNEKKKTAILIDTPLLNPCQRKRTRPLKLKPYKKIKTPSTETIHTKQTSISQPTHTPQTSPESINRPHSSTSHRAEMEERKRRAFLIFNKKTIFYSFSFALCT